MEKPCNYCIRKVCNKLCCDTLKMYEEEQLMLKKIINENEYDRLADQTQCNYWYCEKCGQYVLRTWSKKCLCEEA